MDAASPPTAPFSIRLYRNVWTASLLSNFGGMIQAVGASWTMTTLSGSPRMIALVQATTSLPIMLLSLWAGAVADNLDRRRVMLAAHGFMILTSSALAVLAYLGALTPALLLAFTFLIGCGTAVNGPAWQASVGDMVPRPSLPSAVALNGMGFNIARSAGPAVGGAIVAAAGAAAAFLANALSYLGMIVVLARWRPDRPPRLLPRERIGAAMAAGVRYVALSPAIGAILFRAACFGLAASGVPALMPLIARDLIVGGPLTYGLLLGSFGLGAVGGALASGRLRRRWSTEGIVRLSCLAMAIGASGAAVSRSMPLTAPAMTAAGAGWVLTLSTLNVSVQLASPRWVVARAVALYQVAAYGGLALGSWAFGVIADHRGPAAALFVAAGGLLLVAAIGARWALPALGGADLDPRRDWRVPETAIPVDPRSGPIVVMIEHRVPEENVVTFLELMAERSRILRRDGARRWSLLRDLADPEAWVERYQLPTWLDYVRLNERRTQADAVNLERLRKVRRPESGVVIHRMIERQTSVLPPAQPSDAELIEPITDAARSA